MAEIVGLAASVISIASFAIQLGDSVQKACTFWDSIEDGPDDIRRISADLRWLATFLRVIKHNNKSSTTNNVQDELLREVLESVKKDIDALASLVAELSKAIGPGQTRMKRKWGRVQIVLKGDKINKMQHYIDSAKNSLALLQATRIE